MTDPISDTRPFASRAGLKLAHALRTFGLQPTDWICADLGCHAGGFTDCLLRHGAARVYAVDRGYGVLDYRLRQDPRVVVMERTDARGLHLTQPVDMVTIDVGWTRQEFILPTARGLLSHTGRIISLIKPHYEADTSWLQGGVLPPERLEEVLKTLRGFMGHLSLKLEQETFSPIEGHGGNREVLWLLSPAGP